MLHDQEYKTQRINRLLSVYREIRPDVIVTEMWPYARANFDFELIPLADAITLERTSGKGPSPRLYSIARDIMFPPKISSPDSPGLNNARHDIAYKYFTPRSILVRGDGNLVPIEQSIGVLPDHVRANIDYVGYFGGQPPAKDPSIRPDDRAVLVTSGGGATRDSVIMFEKAMEARKFSTLRDRVWRIIIPHGCSAEMFADMQAKARAENPAGKIIVERNRKDFLHLLSNAALLICHGGNTIIESVNAGVPVLVIPRGLAKNNREQQIRATAFYDKGLIELATLAEIDDPLVLAAKVESAVTMERSVSSIRSHGAAQMAEKITADFEGSRLASESSLLPWAQRRSGPRLFPEGCPA